MNIEFKVKAADLPKKYLEVFNGMFKLTEKELDLAAYLISKYIEYGTDGLKEPYLSKLIFSLEERKQLCAKLGDMSTQNLSNLLKKLKGKQVLLEVKEDQFQLDSSLLPENTVTFKFIIDNDAT